jgi:hypothetical protein
MTLNANIPSFKAFVRKSHFTKNPEHRSEFFNVYVFGLQSVPGKILTFHTLTDNGMMRSRIPISEIFWKVPTADIEPHMKQLWDCFSENVAVVEFDFLKGHRAEVVLRNGSKVWAAYMFTVDWYDNPYSDEPSDYKCGHIFKADNGYLMCQPNNRIFWRDSNWVTREMPKDLQQFKVDSELISVEAVADRWVTDDGDGYYYRQREVVGKDEQE